MKRIKAKVVRREKASEKNTYNCIDKIFSNKKDTEGIFTRGALSLLVSSTFYAVAIMGTLFTILALYCLYSGIAERAIGEVNIFFKIVMPIFSFVMLFYMFIIYKAAGEVEKEKDKNYIVALFSGVTSFAALIVAIASLFVGVR